MISLPLTAIRAKHAGMTLRVRAVMDAVFLSEGSIGSAYVVARRLGLRSRFQLARLLKREGLPPLHRVAEWATVLSWVKAAEQTGASLRCIALEARRHPSACYRLVKEVTGLSWGEARSRGSSWACREFLEEFATTSRPSARPHNRCVMKYRTVRSL